MPIGANAVEEIESMVEEVLAKHPESVDYAVGLTALPHPEQPGVMQPVVVLYLGVKGMVLNTTVHNTGLLAPYGYTQEAIERIVNQLVEALLEARSAQGSGNGDAPSRLLLPGQPLG